MRHLIVILIVHLTFAHGLAQQRLDGKVEVDVKNSKLEWTGRKVGGEHYGEMQLSAGQLLFNKGKLIGGSFEIDMTSIECIDITDPKQNKRLVDHLKSEDFFSVSRFPKSNLAITNVRVREGNTYAIKGDLTIKGKSNPIDFTASLAKVGDRYVAEATLTFDRSKYEIKFGSQSFFENLGDKLVYDDIDLKVKLLLLQEPQ